MRYVIYQRQSGYIYPKMFDTYAAAFNFRALLGAAWAIREVSPISGPY